MSVIFWKNLLKCLPTTTTAPSHPFISSEQQHRHLLPQSTISPTNADAVADSSTTSVMIKDINSRYELSSASTSKSLSTDPSTYSFSSNSDSETHDSPPDLAAVFASQRFFFSSPGSSNSIIESLADQPQTPPLDGVVAVKKYSPDPYADFRKSMQEMIEARKLIKDERTDWDYLHELLSWYLNLNPKHTHKYIISAFADIVICLLSSSDSSASDDHTLQKPVERPKQRNISRWLV